MDTDAIAAEEALRKEEKPQMGAAAAMELARVRYGLAVDAARAKQVTPALLAWAPPQALMQPLTYPIVSRCTARELRRRELLHALHWRRGVPPLCALLRCPGACRGSRVARRVGEDCVHVHSLLIVGVGRYVFKLHNGVESDNLTFLTGMNELLLHLRQHGVVAPYPLHTRRSGGAEEDMAAGSWMTTVEQPLRSGRRKIHAVRVLEFVKGAMMNQQTATPQLIHDTGRSVRHPATSCHPC
jgi:hypothetical protein